MIASCLRNPKVFTVKPLSGSVASRSQWVLGQMNNLEGDPDIQNIISAKVETSSKSKSK